MATRIKLRRDTATRWQNINPVLSLGEPGCETDTGKMKIGDGVKTWNTLNYFADGAGGGAADRLVNGANEVVLGADGTLTLPAGGTISDTATGPGTPGIHIDRTFHTPNDTNSANFGTNTIKLVLADEEGTQITDYLDQGIGVRVWFNVGDNYPITSCVQLSAGVWTITATGMGNRFATFTVTNPLIFIYTGSTPNNYTNFPEYVPPSGTIVLTRSEEPHV